MSMCVSVSFCAQIVSLSHGSRGFWELHQQYIREPGWSYGPRIRSSLIGMTR